MKKLLFLMLTILVLFTLCSFGQQTNLYETIKPYTTPPENIYSGSIKNNIKSENLKSNTSDLLPGDYLIKARNQIFAGVGLQIFSVAFVFVSSDSYSKRITDARSQQEINNLDKNRNMCYVGAGVISLIGFGFELSGIGNIGKAGLSMNENGIGIKIKF